MVHRNAALRLLHDRWQETVASHSFNVPIVPGPSADLLALLGLKSLRAESAILTLSDRDEKLKLIVPGNVWTFPEQWSIPLLLPRPDTCFSSVMPTACLYRGYVWILNILQRRSTFM